MQVLVGCKKGQVTDMKNLLISLGVALMLAAPAALAQGGDSQDEQKPIAGTASGSQSQGYTTQTIVGGAVGIASAGLLIGLAADDNDGGGNVNVGTTTTTTTTTTN